MTWKLAALRSETSRFISIHRSYSTFHHNHNYIKLSNFRSNQTHHNKLSQQSQYNMARSVYKERRGRSSLNIALRSQNTTTPTTSRTTIPEITCANASIAAFTLTRMSLTREAITLHNANHAPAPTPAPFQASVQQPLRSQLQSSDRQQLQVRIPAQNDRGRYRQVKKTRAQLTRLETEFVKCAGLGYQPGPEDLSNLESEIGLSVDIINRWWRAR